MCNECSEKINRKDLTKILSWIERNFKKGPLLPCNLQDMTDRELKIMEVVTHHAVFLKFLQSHIEGTGKTNDGHFDFVSYEVEAERLKAN